MKLLNFIKEKSIDVLLVQEHNIKSLVKIEYLLQHYNVILNKSILFKGGTLILVDKKLPAQICRTYLHPTSRICTLVINVMGNELYLVNMYAPSGKNKTHERENLFENELIYQLVANTDNLIMCGDWNSVISRNDTIKPTTACYSNALKRILTTFKFKDIYNISKKKPEFTYYRRNYAARLDRIYVSKLASNIKDVFTYPVSFSDHHCVCVSLDIAVQTHVARPRWKLNVSLLENENVQANFVIVWSHLLERRNMFPNLIQWWEILVKPQIKTFYITQGKEIKRLKLGLLNYLENNLRELYDNANVNNIIDYDMIHDIKNKIDLYREKEVEGIKVRSRLKDNIHGEGISRHLIAKQKELSQRKIITQMKKDDGTLLTSTPEIKKYAFDFYKNLYSKFDGNNDKQMFFLSFLQNELSDNDREKLCAPISSDELFRTLKPMDPNKTPGWDGLPIEFYQKNWELISEVVVDLYQYSLNTGHMGDSQRKGIITLIPKSEDTLHITNYRPISLLCTDYKILAKILAERIKSVLHKIIHSKQFCGVPGRTINQCNMELRDLIYYANDSNLDLALINLDWYKAFDLVPVDFIFRVLQTLGFGEQFVSWIKILYTGIESALVINNIVGDLFPVCRSVRQGCPLSMSLFLLFQEPFYRAIVASRIIRPLALPDSTEVKILGYADDTTLLIQDDASLLEAFNLIQQFEQAMGSRLNRDKTKIYGTGNWQDREQWPIDGFQTDQEYFYALGIYHNNNYHQSVEKNWNIILDKIKKHTNLLLNRKLDLHQRVVYANSCILSKVWYVAHIYSLPENYVKALNTVLFHYIWGGKYEPIRRTTLYKPKAEGGLSVINCSAKAKTLMVNTFLKCYIHDTYRNSIMFYYCYLRLNNVLPTNYSIHNASPVTSPFYASVIATTLNILKLPRFPYTQKDKIYKSLLHEEKTLAEIQYPTMKWQKIWSNYLSIFMFSYDREIVYKHLHMVLATQTRLYTMNLVDSSKCNKCTSNREETALHLFYECDYIKPLFIWLLSCLSTSCNFRPASNIKLLYFDSTYRSSSQKNICNVFIYIYIITIWRKRKENLRIGDFKTAITKKLIDYIQFLRFMPNRKYLKLYEDLSILNPDNFKDL